MDELDKVYTFRVPAERGYYYVAVGGESLDEAEERLMALPFRDVTDMPEPLVS